MTFQALLARQARAQLKRSERRESLQTFRRDCLVASKKITLRICSIVHAALTDYV
jgi:hypothetical protein